MTGDRVAYRVAASAGREAFRRARAVGCSMEELAALQAVVSLTALYSKLSDEVSVAEIAEEAALHPKNAARALRALAGRGVIVYEPGRGRGNISTVGLLDPTDEKGASRAPLSTREKGADQPPKREPPTRARVDREDREEINSNNSTGGLRVIEGGDDLASRVLAVFNEEAGTDFRGASYLGMIERCLAERPDASLDQHRAATRRTLKLSGREKWWKGNPSPSLVYGNARAFERALNIQDDGLDQYRDLAVYDA